MKEILEMKQKFYLISEDEFKAWRIQYRAKRQSTWEKPEILAFIELGSLERCARTLLKMLIHHPRYADFLPVFIDFFNTPHLQEISLQAKKIRESCE